ncbi:hypothetical protein MO973_38265 [Paenibacillus sp. TRM 82003]|uniref:hypothetical protein n=1 Tax=Kineococcus sp. TRM81007 TaxID=2925831 RepID=UPI001F5674EE|nr:hypothetical protein [Kineococcus sp. TRM81007]MCI2238036.1 hypothetical protein [Kineococcus sp. TRM81007]MCI3926051.1 hypothetical protein [Paenibacillus sp. TRM 82003]
MNRTTRTTALAATALAALAATGAAPAAAAPASAAAASAAAVPTGAAAAPAAIRFAPGATSAGVSGHLAAGGRESYVFRARAGQSALVRLTGSDPSTRFTLVAPDGSPLHTQATEAQDRVVVPLPADGTYVLDVLTTSATDYTLDLALPVPIRFAPGTTSATVRADLAAGAHRQHAFEARAGQSAQVVFDHGAAGSRWTLVAPDGSPLHTQATEVQDRAEVPLPADGTYLLTVLTDQPDRVSLRLTIPAA